MLRQAIFIHVPFQVAESHRENNRLLRSTNKVSKSLATFQSLPSMLRFQVAATLFLFICSTIGKGQNDCNTSST